MKPNLACPVQSSSKHSNENFQKITHDKNNKTVKKRKAKERKEIERECVCVCACEVNLTSFDWHSSTLNVWIFSNNDENHCWCVFKCFMLYIIIEENSYIIYRNWKLFPLFLLSNSAITVDYGHYHDTWSVKFICIINSFNTAFLNEQYSKICEKVSSSNSSKTEQNAKMSDG